MARPTLNDLQGHFTIREVGLRLNLSRCQVKNRIKQQIFGPVSKLGSNGVRLFTEAWIRSAQAVLDAEQRKENSLRTELSSKEPTRKGLTQGHTQ